MSIINGLIDYFKSSRTELTKVSWPSRQQTIRYSTLVVAISIGVAAFFGVMDIGLSKLVNASLAYKTLQPTDIEQQSDQPIIPTLEQNSINFDVVTSTQTNSQPTEQPKSELPSL